MIADSIREDLVGNKITFVVNRNINFTNICNTECKFCAFSREAPFELDIKEIVKRSVEAWENGCTEVCIQGGIKPGLEADFYEKVLRSIKEKVPNIHIHGFSPMEIHNFARLNNISIKEALIRLKNAGLDSIPGTAAEILDQQIRDIICPNKISVSSWIDIIKTAHKLKIPTTCTMMYGHIDKIEHRVNHLRIL
ncbi:MAG: CofH family radical SAM protein, partial [Candidatus Helarchaeota archaeon]